MGMLFLYQYGRLINILQEIVGFMMQIRQVEAFRAVMASGGITAAAAMMRISQPSVSRLISDLERSVGFALFERRGRRLVPTQRADSFNEAVQRSFTGLDLLEQAARRIRAHPTGTLRIVALSALNGGVLPEAIARFQSLHPGVKVTVETQGQHGVEDRVFLGQADIGFGFAAPSREGVRTSVLVRAEYVCLLPPGHRLAGKAAIDVEDLAGESFIGPMHEADALWDDIDRILAERGVPVTRMIETQHSYPAYCFVLAGLGVTVAEPFSAPLFARLGVAVRRFRPQILADFTVLEQTGTAPASPLAQQFRRLVEQVATERLAAVEGLISQGQPPASPALS